MSELVVRPAVAADHTFIMDSWMRSYRKSPDCNLPDDFFFPAYRAVAAVLLKRATVECLVVPDNQDVILGYIVRQPGIVHWVYVKRDYREQGLGHLLVKRAEAGNGIIFTMTTPLGRKKLRYPVKARVLRSMMNDALREGK